MHSLLHINYEQDYSMSDSLTERKYLYSMQSIKQGSARAPTLGVWSTFQPSMTHFELITLVTSICSTSAICNIRSANSSRYSAKYCPARTQVRHTHKAFATFLTLCLSFAVHPLKASQYAYRFLFPHRLHDHTFTAVILSITQVSKLSTQNFK